jgi:hypothetical protein
MRAGDEAPPNAFDAISSFNAHRDLVERSPCGLTAVIVLGSHARHPWSSRRRSARWAERSRTFFVPAIVARVLEASLDAQDRWPRRAVRSAPRRRASGSSGRAAPARDRNARPAAKEPEPVLSGAGPALRHSALPGSSASRSRDRTRTRHAFTRSKVDIASRGSPGIGMSQAASDAAAAPPAATESLEPLGRAGPWLSGAATGASRRLAARTSLVVAPRFAPARAGYAARVSWKPISRRRSASAASPRPPPRRKPSSARTSATLAPTAALETKTAPPHPR